MLKSPRFDISVSFRTRSLILSNETLYYLQIISACHLDESRDSSKSPPREHHRSLHPSTRPRHVIEIAIVAFIISIIAGALGFTGLSRGAAKVAKFFFVLFLILAVLFLVLFFFGISLLA